MQNISENGVYRVSDRVHKYRRNDLQVIDFIEEFNSVDINDDVVLNNKRLRNRKIARNLKKEGLDAARNVITDENARVMQRFRSNRDFGLSIIG